MKEQPSPVDARFGAEYVEKFPLQPIVDGYQKSFQVNIRPFLESDELYVYRCIETGLKFYRGIQPGNSNFYAQLMKFDWYYDPWKWEHEEIKKRLNKSDKLIEIGCGSGGFIQGIKDTVDIAQGIELNEEAVRTCQQKGLDVHAIDLKSFSQTHRAQFDWVVTFQVVEHIENVGDFLRQAATLLKPGGRLVVSVPNNESFIGKSKDNLLNMPPHHMNLWDESSLIKASTLIGCNFEQSIKEPLQPYHIDWYVNMAMDHHAGHLRSLPPLLRGLVYRKTKKTIRSWVQSEAKNIHGHSIIALYVKI